MEILTCPACGGQVPLGDGDTLPCPFCHAPVELPPEHRALRDAERKDAAARQEAADLFARYGKKPSPLLRAAAILFHPVFLILDGFFILLFVAMMGVIFVGQLLSPILHDNVWDTLPDAPKGYGMFILAAGSVLAGMVLGIYGRRRILALRSLQAALAARPPSREGGNVMCRECGAPLHVPDGAEGVRCVYCKADNLVDVPQGWIAGIAASGARIGRAIDEADAWLAGERRRLRRSLILQLSIAGAILVGFIGVIAATASPDPGWRADWSHYVLPPRPLVRLRHGVDKKQLAMGKCERIDTISDECSGGTCRVWLYAALREGEHFSLTGASKVRAVLHSHFWWGKDHEEGFGREVGEAAFTAPWSAWYQLRVDFPENAPELCVSKDG
jgi:LSD1 subclass zinc finger protein